MKKYHVLLLIPIIWFSFAYKNYLNLILLDDSKKREISKAIKKVSDNPFEYNFNVFYKNDKIGFIELSYLDNFPVMIKVKLRGEYSYSNERHPIDARFLITSFNDKLDFKKLRGRLKFVSGKEALFISCESYQSNITVKLKYKDFNFNQDYDFKDFKVKLVNPVHVFKEQLELDSVFKHPEFKIVLEEITIPLNYRQNECKTYKVAHLPFSLIVFFDKNNVLKAIKIDDDFFIEMVKDKIDYKIQAFSINSELMNNLMNKINELYKV